MNRNRRSAGGVNSSPQSRSWSHDRPSPNAENVHNDALAHAQREHARIRESAERAFEINLIIEKQKEVARRVKTETERLKQEAALAEEAAKAIELERTHIPLPKPPPREPTPPPPSPPPKAKPAETPRKASIQTVQQQQQQPLQQILQPIQAPRPKTPPPPARAPSPQLSSSQTLAQAASQPYKPENRTQQHVPRQGAVNPADASAHTFPGIHRYAEIHKTLKKLRASIAMNFKQDDSFKKKAGIMRREIRKSVGQLTDVKGANRTPMLKIKEVLKEALTLQSPGQLDPGLFMLSTPHPVEGALNNGDTLPALFLYLLNVFAKAVVSQFIDEAGVSPKAAEPIGIIAVSIFSAPELCWRNQSLIDILMCKMRVVCPVLFGLRGNEKTEEGRARLGWWKGPDGAWVDDQVHNQRMTGLGAGYAALSLRDFSRVKNSNPYPPTNYWRTIASIVDTLPGEASSTQYIVLKALIENYEHAFMKFYGDAAKAALQVALVDFPGRAIQKTVAVSALTVLGDKLKRDVGLRLQQPQTSRSNGFGFGTR